MIDENDSKDFDYLTTSILLLLTSLILFSSTLFILFAIGNIVLMLAYFIPLLILFCIIYIYDRSLIRPLILFCYSFFYAIILYFINLLKGIIKNTKSEIYLLIKNGISNDRFTIRGFIQENYQIFTVSNISLAIAVYLKNFGDINKNSVLQMGSYMFILIFIICSFIMIINLYEFRGKKSRNNYNKYINFIKRYSIIFIFLMTISAVITYILQTPEIFSAYATFFIIVASFFIFLIMGLQSRTHKILTNIIILILSEGIYFLFVALFVLFLLFEVWITKGDIANAKIPIINMDVLFFICIIIMTGSFLIIDDRLFKASKKIKFEIFVILAIIFFTSFFTMSFKPTVNDTLNGEWQYSYNGTMINFIFNTDHTFVSFLNDQYINGTWEKIDDGHYLIHNNNQIYNLYYDNINKITYFAQSPFDLFINNTTIKYRISK